MPKHRSFNLGLLGVNVRESPLHLEDGELVSAQNAELSRDLAQEGLVKRKGIEAFTPDALAAGIGGIISIPLPDPFTPLATTGTRLYATTVAGTDTHLSTLDGVTWAASNPFDRPALIGGTGLYNLVYQHGGFLSTSGSLYFIGDNGGFPNGKLMRWNGTSIVEVTLDNLTDVFWGPSDPRTLHLIDGAVYALGSIGVDVEFVRAFGDNWDDDGDGDYSNGHSPWSEFFASAFAWGRLWTPSGSQEMGYWPYDNGVFGDFVDQGIFTGNVGATMPVPDMLMTPFGLILALDRNGQDPEVLWKLTDPDGTWTDISPAAPNNKGCWGPMALFDGLLYIARHTDTFGGGGVAYTGCELWSYDGTTLALVKDLTTVVTNANEVRSMVAFNGALYLTVYASTDPTHTIVRTTDAVTFTVPVAKNTADDDRPRGELGFY